MKSVNPPPRISLPVTIGDQILYSLLDLPVQSGAHTIAETSVVYSLSSHILPVMSPAPFSLQNVDPLRDASIHILTQFSKVTKFVRDATTQLSGQNDRPLARSGMLGLPERAPAPPPPASPPQRQASVGLGEALPERGPADAGGEAGMRRVEEDRVRKSLDIMTSWGLLWGCRVLG
jgi:hypothetical protein